VFIEFFKPYLSLIAIVVYEAGPTGYSFYRDLEEAGFPVRVAAPGKTLKSSSSEPKTDHIDSALLAEHASKEILTYINVPTLDEEDDRQLIRLRDQLKNKRKRIKQQVRSFLLQHGIDEPEGLNGYWTIAAINELRCLKLGIGLRFALDELLSQYGYFIEHIKKLEVELKRLDEKHKDKFEIATSHPGVGPITARKFIMEVFRPERFKTDKAIGRFLGLAPNIHSSGESSKKRGVIPAGLATLRCCLIEAAWAWKRIDVKAKKIFDRILKNSGKVQIAISAVARKLGIHLWAMLISETKYGEHKQA